MKKKFVNTVMAGKMLKSYISIAVPFEKWKSKISQQESVVKIIKKSCRKKINYKNGIITNRYAPFFLVSGFLNCLYLFVLPDLLIFIGSLFHNDGSLYDALFKPFFDFLKGCFNFWKDDRVFIKIYKCLTKRVEKIYHLYLTSSFL